MAGISTVFKRSVRPVVPAKSAWIESWGFVLFGLGIYLGLSLITYNALDVVTSPLMATKVANLGGPVGARIAHHILGRIGILSFVWPVATIVWGLLVTLGFVLWPRAQGFLGFLLLALVGAGAAELQLPRMGFAAPIFGFGGALGRKIAIPLLANYGYGGAAVALGVAACVSLVLTGNLRASQTAPSLQYLCYMIVKAFRNVIKLVTVRRKVAAASARQSALFQAKVNAVAAQSVRVGSVSSISTEEKIAVNGGSLSSSGAGKPLRAVANLNAAKALEIDALINEEFDDMDDAKVAEAMAATLEVEYKGPSHGKPVPKQFAKSENAAPRKAGYWEKAASDLTHQLEQFQVHGKVTGVSEGPVVTTFEFAPAPGTKISKISSLSEDLARLLKAKSLRILAPIPGKDVVGFEVPNTERRMIGFQDLIEDPAFRARKMQLPIAMGTDIFGKPCVEDLAEMPHLLVAGSTGSGKSVFMNTLIASLITRHSAKDLRMVLVDPKMVEMAAYNSLPHLACPVVTDPENEAKGKLEALVVEMEDRYQRMRALGAKNITGYNEIIKTRRRSEFMKYEGKWSTMPYIVVIIDELADMMMVLGKAAEIPITRLAQKARAAGIHLVIATQRPSADVVTGLIKANFPTRVAFRVLSGIDSRTILDQSGAEGLLGKGDMLFLSAQGLRRMHGAYLSDKEVAGMVKACGIGK